jgi:hypothetical protein
VFEMLITFLSLFSLIPKDLRGSYYSLFSFQRAIYSFVCHACFAYCPRVSLGQK